MGWSQKFRIFDINTKLLTFVLFNRLEMTENNIRFMGCFIYTINEYLASARV
jgi:hypothetical protein